MAYRRAELAPASSIPEERRGAVLGRFCHGCGAIFSRFAPRHTGKPIQGKDHVSSPCSHEGEDFEAGDLWWEAAVELLPPSAGAADASSGEEADRAAG